MDNENQKSVADQTEVPVENINKTTSPLSNKGLPKVDRKIFIGGVIIILVIISLSVFFLLIRGSNTGKVGNVRDSYNSAISRGDYNKAEEIAKLATKVDANNPQANSAVIDSISLDGNQKGKEQEALQRSQPYIDQILKSGKDDPNALISVGYAYETAGQYQKALEYYTSALNIDSNNASALFHRGHVLQFLNRSGEAYADYEKSYSINPNDPLVLISLGNKALAEGEQQKAFELFMKASETPNVSSTNKAEALTAAALVKRTQDGYIHIDESLSLSKQAVELSPNFSPALAAYGYNLVLVNKKSEGIDYLNRAIEANPKISANYYLLGLAMLGEKKYTDAINDFDDALKSVSEDNTLITTNDKTKANALYLYELAYANDIAGTSLNVMPLLTDAVRLNPNLKSFIKSINSTKGSFKRFEADPAFQSIINS